jgi:hypothetical protein
MFLAAFTIITPTIAAEEEDKPVPGVVYAIWTNPFYFGEVGLGPSILVYMEQPLDPYLVPGITTNETPLPEVVEEYLISVQEKAAQVIVSEEDRPMFFSVTFSGGPIEDKQEFNSFSLFQPLRVELPTRTPYGYDIVREGFLLESLISSDKEIIYEKLVSKYFDEFEFEKFDVTIEPVTKDGTILQGWKYSKCELVDYSVYLNELLGTLKFNKTIENEFRDHWEFQCDGFSFDSEVKTYGKPIPTDNFSAWVPADQSDYAKYIVVRASGGEIPQEVVSTTISKFIPFTDSSKTFVVTMPDNPFDGKPQFLLESLPSKDKEDFYQQVVERYINSVKRPEPFDVTIEIVSGDGRILNSWFYDSCDVTNYENYLAELLLIYKFHPDFDSEYRDRAILNCNGLHFDPTIKKLDIPLEELQTPSNSDRQQVVWVTFSGGSLESPIESNTFTKFAHFTDESDYGFTTFPDAPFGSKPQFFLESLPSNDKTKFYSDIVEKYINKGYQPTKFDVSVDLVTGDGTIIQGWDYTSCEVADYKTFLYDNLLLYKFIDKFESEIRDRTDFTCDGQTFDATQVPSETIQNLSTRTPTVTDEDRAQSFVVSFYDGEIPEKITFHSFQKFEHKTIVTDKFEKPSFMIESLPAKDKDEYYENVIQRIVNPGTDPELFSVQVDVLTGSGGVLQSWIYNDCNLVKYSPYLVDSLSMIKFQFDNTPEIRDQSIFECNGFEFIPESENSYSDPLVSKRFGKTLFYTSNVPFDRDERAMIFLVEFSGGEITRPILTSTISKFESLSSLLDPKNPKEFKVEGLSSKDVIRFYDFAFERYVNPQKEPEPFDAQISVITGDGTILQNWKYSNCDLTNFAPWIDDDLLTNKFTLTTYKEWRTTASFECDGLGFENTAGKVPLPENMVKLKKLMENKNLPILTPNDQIKQGTAPEYVICDEGFDLMLKPDKKSSSCIKETSLSKLSQRGWESIESVGPQEITQEEMRELLLPVKDDDRTQKIVVTIGGTQEIPEIITIDTISKFAPYDSPMADPFYGITAGYEIGSKPSFYLESLPSKEKSILYSEIISSYINPGMTPELFPVTIDLYAGDGTLLETWNYKKCQGIDYEIFLNQTMLTIKFHDQWQAEIQERILIECAGLSVESNLLDESRDMEKEIIENKDPTKKNILLEFEENNSWRVDFADLPADFEPAIYELDYGIKDLPENIGGKGIYVQGHNRSDDLFMFLFKEFSDLQPNTKYDVFVEVTFATNVPQAMMGIGGSPGESVYVKVGATRTEPKISTDDQNHFRVDIKKSNQSQSGEEMVVVGNIASELVMGNGDFALKTLANNAPVKVSSNDDGSLWIIVGTDSGFEGLTQLYYDQISIDLIAN